MAGFATWADLRAPDFKTLTADTVAILPLGATEQHGPHLPLSVDSRLTETVIDRAATYADPQNNVLVLPTLHITKSTEHIRHAGTLTLSAATLAAVLDDICASVARAGVTRLVFFNGHGGNTALLHVAARAARIDHGLYVVTAGWSAFAETDGHFDAEAHGRDMHAGDSETSAMLATAAHLVDMEKAPADCSLLPEWARTHVDIGFSGQPAVPAWAIDDLTPNGVIGDASIATAEKGEALLDSAARNFAVFLAEFAAFAFVKNT